MSERVRLIEDLGQVAWSDPCRIEDVFSEAGLRVFRFQGELIVSLECDPHVWESDMPNRRAEALALALLRDLAQRGALSDEGREVLVKLGDDLQDEEERGA